MVVIYRSKDSSTTRLRLNELSLHCKPLWSFLIPFKITHYRNQVYGLVEFEDRKTVLRNFLGSWLIGIAPSASRCPPALKSCGSRRCSSAALWRRAPAGGSVWVGNTPAPPGSWPPRPHRPGRPRSCVSRPAAHRGWWVEPGGSRFSALRRAPPLPLLHPSGWAAGWGNCGPSSWPAGRRRRRAQAPPTHPLDPPRWNERLDPAALATIFLWLQHPEESINLLLRGWQRQQRRRCDGDSAATLHLLDVDTIWTEGVTRREFFFCPNRFLRRCSQSFRWEWVNQRGA